MCQRSTCVITKCPESVSKSWAICSTACLALTLLLCIRSSASGEEKVEIRPTNVQTTNGNAENTWAVIEAHVWHALEQKKGFQRKDLLTQADAKNVLDRLRKAGWNVPKQEQLLEYILADSHPLVTTLQGSKGTAFMRKVSDRKNIFDQLDRLTQLPGGTKTLKSMVQAKDGQKLVDYYFGSAAKGNTLTQTLPRGISGKPPKDADFEKPTGKIYNGEQFLVKLKIIFEAQAKAVKKS